MIFKCFKRKAFLSWAFVLSYFIYLPLCFAQQPTTEAEELPKVEPIIVTVSSQAIPLSATSASVTVLTREFISNSRTETVAELLRQVPFLHLSQTGGLGGLTTVTLRGGDPNFTLVMIDGVPVNDPTNLLGGSFDFSTLSTDNIEQIEIVRGPLSSLYGSEAMSGVINIISRSGKNKPRISAQGLLGNFAARQIGLASEGVVKKFQYSVAGSYLETGEQVEKDEFSLATISLTSNFNFTKNQSLRLTIRNHDSDSAGFPENGGGPKFSILRSPKNNDVQERILGVDYSQDLKEWWSYQIDFDYYQRLNDSFTPAILDALPPTFRSQPSILSETDFKRNQFRYTNTWKPWNTTSFVLGFGLRHEDGTNDGVIAETIPSNFNLDRRTVAISSELLYSSGNLNTNFGLRADDSENFDVEISPRVGLSYLVNSSGTRLRGSWGEGFKLPSFFVLGEPNFGNPELKPEKSRGFDLGVEQSLAEDQLQFSATYFHNRFQDLIDFSAEQFRFLNRSLATDQGLELEANLKVAKNWKLNGHLSFVDAEIKGTDEPLRDRPRWRGGVGLEWEPTSRSYLRLDTLWLGSRFDFQLPVPEMEKVGGYSTTNLVFSHKLNQDFGAYIRIENLFDQEYQNFIGFPDPGIFVRVGITYNPGR